jgi:hypothetical protein
MADTGRTVWADGFWADGFWAAGLWAADEPVAVPDVDDPGTAQAAAVAAIEGATLVAAVLTAYSSTIPVGEVISQNPAAGTLVAPGSTVTITVSLGVEPVVERSAAAGSNKRRRKYFVQIDGQDFEVRDEKHAREVLQHAVALADRAAEKQLHAKPARAAKVKPVKLPVPEIRTNAPIDLAPYQEAIERAYRNAAVAAELRLLLEAQDRDDEEAAAYLLLH